MNKALRIQLVQGPAGDPVTLTEAALHCRVDDARDHQALALMIKAATRTAETFLRRPIVSQKFRQYFDRFPRCNAIELRRSPLISVEFLKTYDDADAATTFASSNYYVDTASSPGRLVLRSAASWPTYDRVANPIEVEYRAGFGAAPVDIPADIRQAVLMLTAALYEHRGDKLDPQATTEIPALAYELLHPWRDPIA